MADVEAIKMLIDTGGLGIALFALYKVWQRLTHIEDRLFMYLADARKQRHEMQSELTELRLRAELKQKNSEASNRDTDELLKSG